MRFDSRDSATAFVIGAIVLPLSVVALVVGSEDWPRAPAPLAVAVCGAVTLVLTARFRSWTAARHSYPANERRLAELVRSSPIWLGGLWPLASPFGVDVELIVTAAVVAVMWLVASVHLNARGAADTVDPKRALRRRWDLVALVFGVWALAVGTDPSPTAASVRADVTLASAAALIALYWDVFAYLRADVSLTREQRQRADDPWLLAIGVGLLQYWTGSAYGVVAAALLAAASVRLSEGARARALVRAGVGPPPRRRGRVPQASRDRLHQIMSSRPRPVASRRRKEIDND